MPRLARPARTGCGLAFVHALRVKVGCLIVDGAGGRAFCAGGDVQMIREERNIV